MCIRDSGTPEQVGTFTGYYYTATFSASIVGPILCGTLCGSTSYWSLFIYCPIGDISLYINSPGGSISAGMAIHDTMQYIKCDVSTICMGMAASMGAFLLASGTKGKRFALPNSEILIHQPLIGGQGGGLSGQTTDIKIHAEHMVYIRDKMNRMLSEYTGQPLEKIQLDTERDNYMSALQAKEYGLIDEVIAHR